MKFLVHSNKKNCIFILQNFNVMRVLIAALALLIILVSLYPDEKKMSFDSNSDGKHDDWIICNADQSQISRYDFNKDGKYTEDWYCQGFLIKEERIDFNHDGTVDTWISHIYKNSDVTTTIEMDTNKDNIIDVWQTKLNGFLIKRVHDLNFDKVPDEFSFYEAGHLIREELDTNNDTKVDDVYHYFADKLVKQEIDNDFNGRFDLWIEYTYKGRALQKASIIKDNNGDGKPDEWHHTNNKRQVTRIEYDKNFDGRIDKVEKFLN